MRSLESIVQTPPEPAIDSSHMSAVSLAEAARLLVANLRSADSQLARSSPEALGGLRYSLGVLLVTVENALRTVNAARKAGASEYSRTTGLMMRPQALDSIRSQIQARGRTLVSLHGVQRARLVQARYGQQAYARLIGSFIDDLIELLGEHRPLFEWNDCVVVAVHGQDNEREVRDLIAEHARNQNKTHSIDLEGRVALVRLGAESSQLRFTETDDETAIGHALDAASQRLLTPG